jgi:superfamily II DNA or RNA helicase
MVLRAIRRRLPDGTPERIPAPLIPLLDTTILTNAPGEPGVGHQIQAEIASADRIDLVMAFIRRSGINPLKEALRRHAEDGKPLRVLTTVYTGTTEADALEELRRLGAAVRVSYDTTGTRLHAKAWLFHRESGYSTAYIGSSNLTHSAQVTGLEWNVRVSAARNRPVIDKIGAVFESYWQQSDFEEYDPDRFRATMAVRAGGDEIMLTPLEIRLEPFQERLLEQIELSRLQGHHRNLLVSATGTGKTVMAAVDYATLRQRLPRARLLFVAHREEILAQSRATFAHALRDGAFGELWVGGEHPVEFTHVFASIQSLTASGLRSLDPSHFDVVIVDEFHHAGAASYERLLTHLHPVELLGLTATPERSDGLPVLQWFGNRIAAELRLWDAIDQHRLVPFTYFGIADNLDLTDIPWRRGTGYDVERLTEVITATDVWGRGVVKQFKEHLGGKEVVRALAFCVSVTHARYMARVFNESAIAAVAVWADSSDEERRQALRDLSSGVVKVVFSVDLFNEGVDVPTLNALLMLRPTESPLLFLQQLGRGLRKAAGKSVCTVLDFVGQHRREFRYDRRFQALLGGSRRDVERQVAAGFPFLPSGCSMQLDRVATERVLESIRNAVPVRWGERVGELLALAGDRPGITLREFLAESGLAVADLYRNDRSWSELRQAAGIVVASPGPHENAVRSAIGRLLHVDDDERLRTWREWAVQTVPPAVATLSTREQRLLRMLLAQLLGGIPERPTLAEGAKLLWGHPEALRELAEVLDVLADHLEHVPLPFASLPDVPLVIHARYSRLEILAAVQAGEQVRGPAWREGVRYEEHVHADLFVLTLDKTQGQFSPSTRYRDYAISRELIHWESQSTTSASSPTGRRYQRHAEMGSHVLLFARLNGDERGFVFLGPATYESHVGELPMAITWRLAHRLPGDLFEKFAAAVA